MPAFFDESRYDVADVSINVTSHKALFLTDQGIRNAIGGFATRVKEAIWFLEDGISVLIMAWYTRLLMKQWHTSVTSRVLSI